MKFLKLVFIQRFQVISDISKISEISKDYRDFKGFLGISWNSKIFRTFEIFVICENPCFYERFQGFHGFQRFFKISKILRISQRFRSSLHRILEVSNPSETPKADPEPTFLSSHKPSLNTAFEEPHMIASRDDNLVVLEH